MEELKRDLEQFKLKAAEEKKRADSAERKLADKNKSFYVKKGKKIGILMSRQIHPDDINVEDWVTDVQRHISSLNVVSDKTDFILDHIDGNVRWEVQARNLTNPSDILQVIVKTFGVPDSVGKLQEEFFNRSQKPNETILDFSISLLHLNEQIKQKDEAIPLKMLKGKFIEGVHDESLKRELRKLNAEKPDLNFCEFRDKGVEWIGRENLSKKNTSIWETTVTSQNNNSLEKQLKEQSEQISQLKGLIETSIKTQATTVRPPARMHKSNFRPHHPPPAAPRRDSYYNHYGGPPRFLRNNSSSHVYGPPLPPRGPSNFNHRGVSPMQHSTPDFNVSHYSSPSQMRPTFWPNNNPSRPLKTCFFCNSADHLIANCPHKQQQGN